MTFEMRILQPSDLDAVLQLEREILKTQPSFVERSELENEMLEWHAPWRKEALEHYLPLGWSFGLWTAANDQLSGYFLAQPQVFTRGLTQSLWVERLTAPDASTRDQLLDVAYRLCREKHFQKLFIRQSESLVPLTTDLPFKIERHEDQVYEIKTSKM